MPKRKRESREDKWLRKMKKYEDKLSGGRRRAAVIYSSDEEQDQPPELSQIEEPESIMDTAQGESEVPLSEPVQYELVQVENQTEDVQHEDGNVQPHIEPELLSALGEVEADVAQWGENIVDDLARRWEPILRDGLTSEVKKLLIKNISFPANCKFLKAPLLNPELSSMLTESARLRDTRIAKKQSDLGCALSVLGKVMSGILTKTLETKDVIKELTNVGKLLTSSHHGETETRRSLIIPMIDKSFIDPFKDRKRDDHLFGEKLGDFIKSSRGIRKTGQLISTNHLNWRGPSSHQQYQRKMPIRAIAAGRAIGGPRTSNVVRRRTAPPLPPPSVPSRQRAAVGTQPYIPRHQQPQVQKQTYRRKQ